jgi:hypothetical protein
VTQIIRVRAVPKSLLGRCLLVIAIMCGVAVVPALVVSAYVGYYMLVPRYSAVADFDTLGFNLRLDLFLSDDEARDSGRYLSIINGGSYHTVMIPGWDWSHRARTSVYSIDANHIAVLSALGYDEEITLRPFGVAPIASDNGEHWEYLGAFDFTFPHDARPRLQFFDAQQLAECIPMGANSDPSNWAGKARPEARRATCPTVGPSR